MWVLYCNAYSVWSSQTVHLSPSKKVVILLCMRRWPIWSYRDSSNTLASVCKTTAGEGGPTALDQHWHATTNAPKKSTTSPHYHHLTIDETETTINTDHHAAHQEATPIQHSQINSCSTLCKQKATLATLQMENTVWNMTCWRRLLKSCHHQACLWTVYL